jgi:hypothetical protein
MTSPQLEEFRKDLVVARFAALEFGKLTTTILGSLSNDWFFDAPSAETEIPMPVLDMPDEKRASLMLTILDEMLEALALAIAENDTPQEASIRLTPLWTELFALHAPMINKDWQDSLPSLVEDRIAILEEVTGTSRQEILEATLASDTRWLKALSAFSIGVDDLKY